MAFQRSITFLTWSIFDPLLNRVSAQLLVLFFLGGCAAESPLMPVPETADHPVYKEKAVYNRPYKVKGKTYYPMDTPIGYRERGIASWYGAESGNRTAMGSRFKPNQISAAHKTLPLPCKVRVTNLRNGRVVDVLVNDRGPFHGDRLIDLSHGAAKQLGMRGTAEVEIEYLGSETENF